MSELSLQRSKNGVCDYIAQQYFAVASNNVKACRHIVSHNIHQCGNCNAPIVPLPTLLMVACMRGCIDTVRYLLQEGESTKPKYSLDTFLALSPLNAQFSVNGWTALMYAAIAGQASATIVNLLLAQGCDHGIRNWAGKTVADITAEVNNTVVLESMIEHGICSPAYRQAYTHVSTAHPIFKAIETNDMLKALELIATDTSFAMSPTTTNSVAPLFYAVKKGNLSMVKLLVGTAGCKHIDVQDEEGFTPLSRAVFFGHTEIALYLASRNTDPNQSTGSRQNGHTALELVQMSGDRELYRILTSNQSYSPFSSSSPLMSYASSPLSASVSNSTQAFNWMNLGRRSPSSSMSASMPPSADMATKIPKLRRLSMSFSKAIGKRETENVKKEGHSSTPTSPKNSGKTSI